ncbi:MAG: ECF-type sigma factor, partial [Planctomycetota bacterium]
MNDPKSAPSDSSLANFTRLVDQVREGDEQATGELWNRYFRRLVRVAAGRLPASMRRTGDEEDVALSAFNSFVAGVRKDKFPDLSGPDNLWGLLITLTSRKVHAHIRLLTRQKRGGGQVRGESAFMDSVGDERFGGIGGVHHDGVSPDLEIELTEACQELLDRLPDDDLRQIAILRMEGFLVDEIAAQLKLSKRA